MYLLSPLSPALAGEKRQPPARNSVITLDCTEYTGLPLLPWYLHKDRDYCTFNEFAFCFSLLVLLYVVLHTGNSYFRYCSPARIGDHAQKFKRLRNGRDSDLSDVIVLFFLFIQFQGFISFLQNLFPRIHYYILFILFRFLCFQTFIFLSNP